MSIVGTQWQEKNILITVKTYPTASKKYQETVCTAGITEDGEWIRLYPVRFRFLTNDQQYGKYTWIRAQIRKADNDFRPDSYRIDESSIQLLRTVPSSNGWHERNQIVLPTVANSLEELRERYEKTGHSLGIFRPKRVLDVVCEQDLESTRAKRNEFINQLTLFGTEPPKELEPIPYKFSYSFECDDQRCSGHKAIILDWEIFAAYFRFKRNYGEQRAIQQIQKKWLEQLCSAKSTHILS